MPQRKPILSKVEPAINLAALLGLMLLLAACVAAETPTPVGAPTVQATLVPTRTLPPPTPTATATPAPISVFAPGGLPEAARAAINAGLAQQPGLFVAATDPNSADLQIAYAPNIERGVPMIGSVVFALVARLPTLVDDVPWSAVQAAWQGQPIVCEACTFTGTLRLSASTLAALRVVLGEPASGAVEVVAPDQLLPTVWDNADALGIVPFDQLTVRLKVLSIDGLTPLHHGLDLNAYPLVVKIGLAGSIETAQKLQAIFSQPITNRDESQLTLLAMTGVTAMSRNFGAEMDEKGVLYPAELVKDWFTSSDLVHISNENSFMEGCPKPPVAGAVFCSDPSYMQLLTDVHTSIIELTGNHLTDYGWQPLSYTLGLYDQLGIPYFGGGRTLAEATRAVTLTHNGNVIAFVGCNPIGPWLTDERPGAAPCASPYPEMQAEITKAVASGAVVVATLQYYETPLGDYSYETAPVQKRDFAYLAAAGASIVSGSQGHSVQGFGLQGNTFIHYGVGNLFFDQMQALNLRQNFIDRYVIYDNRVLSVELLATIRDSWSRIRKMTPEEKRDLLKTLFELSYWEK